MSFVFQDLSIVNNWALFVPFKWKHFPRNRMLVWVTYWLDAQRHGKNADGWRATNMMMHLFNVALLLPLSVVAAVLFLVHPLTTMGHSYIAGRSGVIQAAFQLVAGMAVLSDRLWLALAVAGIAAIWVKEDSIVMFPMMGVLWML